MFPAKEIVKHRGLSRGCTRRARSALAKAAPSVFCETLEGRVFLSVDSWVITWTGTTPTSATLEPGPFPGQINVFLNTNTSSNPRVPDHPFTNTSGLDILKLASLSGFTVIDKVPAAVKPQYNGGPATEEGIKVQGGTNVTLVIDLSGRIEVQPGVFVPTHPNDTLVQVKDSSYVEVSDRSGSAAVDSLTHFESGVNHIVIKTNNVNASGARLPFDAEDPMIPEDTIDPFADFDNKSPSNWRSGEGTNVFVNALPSGIDVLVDTGAAGTFNKVLLGHDSIAEQVTVLTGEGHDTVALQRENGDDVADALVDFVYGNQLGLGNQLIVQSEGTAHLGNAPQAGTAHPTYVDKVRVRGGGSGTRGEVILEQQATIDDLNVEAWGILTWSTDDAIVNDLFVDENGDLIAEAEADIGDFLLRGEAFFNASSATSTIDALDLRGSGVLDLDGDAVVTVTTLTSHDSPTINAPNTSTLTVTTGDVIDGTLNMNLADQGAADVRVTGTFTVSGTLNVNDGGLLTVGTLACAGTVNLTENAEVSVTLLQGSGTVNVGAGALLEIATVQQMSGTINVNSGGEAVITTANMSGTINVNAGGHAVIEETSNIQTVNVNGAGATVLIQDTQTHITNLTIVNGGLVTLEPLNQTPTVSPVTRVLFVDNLNLGGPSGVLDLTDGALIVKYEGGSPYNTIKQLLIEGYDNEDAGRWDGLGIITSRALASYPTTSLGYAETVNTDFTITSFAGETINYDAVMVRYTFEGDVDLDARVEVDDLGVLATHWQDSNRDWREANFDYNYPTQEPLANVNVADLGLLASNWQAGVPNYNGPSFNEEWDRLMS
jgi:hypothetical protein